MCNNVSNTTTDRFKKSDKQVNFPAIEKEILDKWKELGVFERSLEKNRGKESFLFYDGPPFATGLPHYGHILPGTIKDIVPRFQTMKGKFVERKWGWDCHGLPVENLIENELGLKDKNQLLEYGIDNFNEACRNSVLRYTNEWEKTVDRMGRWVDFKNSYRTMDPEYMESIWWVFKTLWSKGLIYEGFKILPYCGRCTTPLSNFETNQGYKDVQDPAITVAFQLRDSDEFILAWTTTPWTLPSNTGLAVGKDIDYALIEADARKVILAKDLIGRYYKDDSSYTLLREFKGAELIGRSYEPLFPYFKDLENGFRVVDGHHVSTETGTGIVHIAPGFGEDDAEIGKKEGLPAVCPIDAEGKFTEEVIDYKGRWVKEADKDIIRRLKDEKKVIKHDTYMHSYPHCWRCDEPLIYKAVSSWFVDIAKIKDKMLSANQKIDWVPEHIKEGRFGKWLENARDWAISRNRYWGCPIPVWKCECGETVCIGSIEEIESLSGKKINDIHKHFVDPIVLKCTKCGSESRRVEEVLDCWFESGAMPYAQNHYPFENKEKFESSFPADFIAEGIDQTRGWFYTLVVLGAALFDTNPFKSVVVNGLVLAEDGRKMSKRLKNYPEISVIFDKYGADALRLFLMNSSAVKAGELLFNENGVQEVLRSFHLPLWNAYSFFVTYALVDKWTPENNYDDQRENLLDKWLSSFTEKLVGEVDKYLTDYEFQAAIRALYKYLDELTNWYIRRSRRRFWKSEDDSDKKQAYSTLYTSLVKFCQVAAPIAPFLTEEIYKNLTGETGGSVHLSDYPVENASLRNIELEREMDLVQRTVEMGRSLRSKVKINLRKPLSGVHLITKDPDERRLLESMSEIIKEELNVKSVLLEDDEEKLVKLSCKANFKVMGKKLGKDMKDAAQVVVGFGKNELNALSNGTPVKINVNSTEYELTSDDLIIERTEKEGLTVLNEGSLTIALDTLLTKELIAEGVARDFIRQIQNLRKESGFDVTDRIKILFKSNDEIREAIESQATIIQEETLCTEISLSDSATTLIEVDEAEVMVTISR